MKAEFANPFIKAAVMTFRQDLKVELNRNNIGVRDSPAPTRDISIIIGVTGVVKGQVVYSMDSNVAYEVAKAMLPGKLPVDLKRLTNSAVSELANIITGQASIILAGDKQRIDITPPAVLIGNPVSFDFISIKSICLTFLSAIGSIEVNIALMEE
jgi:chemotaxis protein CheX